MHLSRQRLGVPCQRHGLVGAGPVIAQRDKGVCGLGDDVADDHDPFVALP